MLEFHQDNETALLVLRPNRSMTWRGNLYVIASLFLLSGAIGIGFALLGAWVILPFAGLEITALATSLYYLSWKLSYRQVLRISTSKIILEKGVYYPKQRWEFAREGVELKGREAEHEWEGPTLFLCAQGERIQFGEFLNKTERLSLRDYLVGLSLPIRFECAHSVDA